MKRTIITVLLILIVTGFTFAQVGDARTRGMANAFTAVADDVNTLFFNPAGLGYFKTSTFSIDLGGNVELSKRMVFGQEEYPWIWEEWNDNNEMRYMYWDDFLGLNVIFDPAEYGFPYDPDAPPEAEDSYKHACEAYMEFREYYDMYEFNQNMSDMQLYPRIAYATKNWGVSSFSRIAVELDSTEYRGADTEMIYNVNKDVGLMAAFGMNFGFLGLDFLAAGANLKSYVRKVDTVSFYGYEAEDGPPKDFFPDLLMGTDAEEKLDSRIELGIGLLFTMGPWNGGVYLDNLLFFLGEDEGTTTVDTIGIFDTLSVGVAFTPYNEKLSDKRKLLNLIAAVDLKNLGSENNRMLTAGLEAGLNLASVIVVNGRLGYRQDLPGTLDTMIDSFDPKLGFYSIGLGAKFLFGGLDVTFDVPSDMVFDPPQGSISEERLDTPFGKIVVNLNFSF